MTLPHTEKTDLEKICKQLGLTFAEERFMREVNPMHYMGNLLDLGFTKYDAQQIAEYYEKYVYIPIIESYNHMRELRRENNGIRK